jgi:hypothetical protein
LHLSGYALWGTWCRDGDEKDRRTDIYDFDGPGGSGHDIKPQPQTLHHLILVRMKKHHSQHRCRRQSQIEVGVVPGTALIVLARPPFPNSSMRRPSTCPGRGCSSPSCTAGSHDGWRKYAKKTAEKGLTMGTDGNCGQWEEINIGGREQQHVNSEFYASQNF